MTTKAQKVGLYWRKSRFFGGMCPPGIFTLTTERLTFTTDEGVLFDLPIADVRATLSAWGTLTIRSGNASWDLLATAGQESRTFNRAQQRELGSAGAKRPDPSAGTRPVRDLAATLATRGVRTDIRRPINSYVLYTGIALGVAVLVAALLLAR